MNRICIIAEAGVNHNGDIELAKKMIDVAKSAGADYIKFQTFNPEKLVTAFAEKAEYQKETTGNNDGQLEMLKKISLSYEEFADLKRYCDNIGIGFISTPFDLESIDFLEKLDMDFWKIPSGEITNLPYLEKIAKTHRKVIMSTGMCNLEEIEAAIDILERNGAKDIELLHCNTQYPTPFQDVNLNAMCTMRNKMNKAVGYSDHTIGIEVPIAAVAMGAKVIEKHFTLNKDMEGPDHRASLEPKELQDMIKAIRNIEFAMGNGKKEVSPSEISNKNIARKSIVAKKKIKKGEIFSEENITTKRPGTGINPMKWYDVIGSIATRNFDEDEMIEL